MNDGTPGACPEGQAETEDADTAPSRLEGAASPPLRAVDEDAYVDWDEIYSDNATRLYRLMYSKVGNRSDAEDLTAEVFLAALRPLRTSASRREVRAYLAATAQTVLAGFWRRRLGREVTTIDLVAAVRAMDDPQPDPDAPERAKRLLDALPDNYRRVLELRFLESLSIKDTAREMDVTVANAKVLQHRALRLAANSTAGEPT
jgi:RNA polymerase sigma factor (sigma-70 family)